MNPEAGLLVENAAQLLTLAGGDDSRQARERLGIISGGSVGIKGEKILWAGRPRL
jgi:hypothetical protein